MKLPKKLRDQMEEALTLLETELNELQDDTYLEPEQQTNIFKILKLEKYEIRHGAFLDFLLDPERNVQLADYFASSWLEQIADELGMDDSAVNDIVNGEDFEINKIIGEERYSEIAIRDKGNLRIDHALELKVGNRRRVLVFEYKVDGVVQNDLEAYEEFVRAKYPGKQSDVYFFIVDLGGKVHTGEVDGAFKYLNKSTVVHAIENTLEEAQRRDMQATRMYLQQYLEILDPDMCDGFFWHGMEENLWNSWNPEICRHEDAGDVWDELADGVSLSENDQSRLEAFLIDELFVQSTMSELSEHHIECNRNQTWLRIKLPKNPFQYFYLNCWFCDYGEQLYLGVTVACWAGRNYSDQTANDQQKMVLEVVSNSAEFDGLIADVENLREPRNIWWSSEKQIVWGNQRRAASNRKFDSGFSFLHPVSMEEFKAICTAEVKPPVFDMYIKNILNLYDACNRSYSS